MCIFFVLLEKKKIRYSDKLVKDTKIKPPNINKIPNIIVQSFSSRRVTDQIKENIENWISKNPDYLYSYFDELDIVDFIKDHYSERYLNAFYKINPGAGRADFFRYLYLYKKGGFWIDVTAVCLKPFNQIVDKEVDILLVHDKEVDNIYNAVMGFPKNHPVMKECVERCLDNIEKETFKNKGKYCIYHTTGPELVKEVFEKYSKNNKGVNIKILTKELDRDISKYNIYSRIVNYEKYYIYDGQEKVIKTKFKNSCSNLKFVSNKPYYERMEFFNNNRDYIENITNLSFIEKEKIINKNSEIILVIILEKFNPKLQLIFDKLINNKNKFHKIIIIDNFSNSIKLSNFYNNFLEDIEIYINPIREKEISSFVEKKIVNGSKKIVYFNDLNLKSYF